MDHIHLDPVGGIAGDMFIAAILDGRPDLASHLENVLASLQLKQTLHIEQIAHTNGVLTGSRYSIREDEKSHHHHNDFKQIRTLIQSSGLSTEVKVRAINIFEHLARAEARVHGTSFDEVSFHEVGALDSIVDIVFAAFLIEKLGPCSWSVGAVPMGAGRTMSQHGIIPLPAPATLLLLEDLPVFDDGVKGERVTPTGAAILKHLAPSRSGPISSMRLSCSGTGFGTAELSGLPNILRAIFFEPHEKETADRVTVFNFEIDDQTAEDLAVGLENLRTIEGVLDVTVSSVVGKKGRQANHVQLLGEPGAKQRIFDACFAQTTTLGIRHHAVERRILERQQVRIGDVGVKIANRPSGPTAKAEMADLAGAQSTTATRSSNAHTACTKALNSNALEPVHE